MSSENAILLSQMVDQDGNLMLDPARYASIKRQIQNDMLGFISEQNHENGSQRSRSGDADDSFDSII